MTRRYSKSVVRWDKDPHPRWDTHYDAQIYVFDDWTGAKVGTVEGFSTISGAEAVNEAVDKASALIRELESKLPTEDQVFAAVCACAVAKQQNNAHRDCIAKELGIGFAPHVDRYCETLEQDGLVEVQPPFIRLTPKGIAQCREQESLDQQETPLEGEGQSWEL